MSFDVGKSRISDCEIVLDDERSNEIGNEGGASGLVFFGMQVELALPNTKAAYHPDFTPIGLWTKAAYNKNRLM
jgi:hypothetical protein